MVLFVDDLLSLPAKFFEIILNTVIQTAYKTKWAQYRRDLIIVLMRAKRDYAEGRISKEEMKQIESRVFQELRLSKKVLGTSIE